jgi:hypothetical protein
MYTLILFYVLAGKFHTDVSAMQVVTDSEQLCHAAVLKVESTLRKAHKDVSEIEWTCIQTKEKSNG